MSLVTDAYATIDGWMEVNHPELYPEWLAVVPGDGVNGWGADDIRWPQDAGEMVAIFEARVGAGIASKPNEIDKLRSSQLIVFRKYLTAKANAVRHPAGASMFLAVAKALLA